MSPEELEAILTFREEHLEIREVYEVLPGRISVDRWGWGPGAWGLNPWDSSRTRDLRQVREHNETLRQELGLTPDQAWRELTSRSEQPSEQVVEVDVDAR